MRHIYHRSDLAEVARQLGVRPDWHEPDEQNVDAIVVGQDHQLDNAMGADPNGRHEPNVIITKNGTGVAVVDLATLLAWASGYQDDSVGERERRALVTIEVAERIGRALATGIGAGQSAETLLGLVQVLVTETSTRTTTAVKDQGLSDRIAADVRATLQRYPETRATG